MPALLFIRILTPLVMPYFLVLALKSLLKYATPPHHRPELIIFGGWHMSDLSSLPSAFCFVSVEY